MPLRWSVVTVSRVTCKRERKENSTKNIWNFFVAFRWFVRKLPTTQWFDTWIVALSHVGSLHSINFRFNNVKCARRIPSQRTTKTFRTLAFGFYSGIQSAARIWKRHNSCNRISFRFVVRELWCDQCDAFRLLFIDFRWWTACTNEMVLEFYFLRVINDVPFATAVCELNIRIMCYSLLIRMTNFSLQKTDSAEVVKTQVVTDTVTFTCHLLALSIVTVCMCASLNVIGSITDMLMMVDPACNGTLGASSIPSKIELDSSESSNWSSATQRSLLCQCNRRHCRSLPIMIAFFIVRTLTLAYLRNGRSLSMETQFLYSNQSNYINCCVSAVESLGKWTATNAHTQFQRSLDVNVDRNGTIFISRRVHDTQNETILKFHSFQSEYGNGELRCTFTECFGSNTHIVRTKLPFSQCLRMCVCDVNFMWQ